jgi:hypothetical protein
MIQGGCGCEYYVTNPIQNSNKEPQRDINMISALISRVSDKMLGIRASVDTVE